MKEIYPLAKVGTMMTVVELHIDKGELQNIKKSFEDIYFDAEIC